MCRHSDDTLVFVVDDSTVLRIHRFFTTILVLHRVEGRKIKMISPSKFM